MSPRKRVPTSTPVASAPGSLVGIAEISEKAGVSKARVSQLIQRTDFPAPVVQLRMGKVWRARPVERWLENYRRGQS